MRISEHLAQLRSQFDIVGQIDLDASRDMKYSDMQTWLQDQCTQLYRSEYQPNQRIVVTITHDRYVKSDRLGVLIRNLQVTLNKTDISNFFVTVVSTNPAISSELKLAQALTTDQHAIIGIVADDTPWAPTTINKYPSSIKEIYEYDSVNPLKISINDLSKKEQDLLTANKTFCIYPWIHLNANPDGQAYPCCMTDHAHAVGNCKVNTLEEIWNNDAMKQVRLDMLADQPIAGCSRCYEQEKSGFFSGRLSANKHHGHHISRVLETQADGSFDRFEMIYWDIRYSNLCNLRCRSCGHIYSSQWYQDQAKIAGTEWAKNNTVLNIAGRSKTDMWEQLRPHLEHVEQIYFAGGEPLLMDEHYNILDELERLGRFDVRLIYNTNFTQTKLKDRWVFDYWRKFESVSVGASLDAMGPRAEYIRKGTTWDTVERNREKMLEICPGVDFYVSATLSILNALHLPDFHKSWTDRGFIKAQDLNVNILLDPSFYRIDIAKPAFKQAVEEKFNDHLDWLRPQDPLQRATVGFESAIKFINATDNSHLLTKFWGHTRVLDELRNEDILTVIPELQALK